MIIKIIYILSIQISNFELFNLVEFNLIKSHYKYTNVKM